MQRTLLPARCTSPSSASSSALDIVSPFNFSFVSMYILKVPTPKAPDPPPSPEHRTSICYFLLLFLPEFFSLICQTQRHQQRTSYVLSDHLQFVLYPLVLINSPKLNSSCILFSVTVVPSTTQIWRIISLQYFLHFPLPPSLLCYVFIISCPDYLKFNKRFP